MSQWKHRLLLVLVVGALVASAAGHVFGPLNYGW